MITFPPGHYKGTTFEDAAVEVTLLPPKSLWACVNPGEYEVSTSPDALFQIDAKSPYKMIDGTRFLHSSHGAGAMSHDVAGDVYRGYKNGKCYELSPAITFTNFSVYDPGTVKEFHNRGSKAPTRSTRTDPALVPLTPLIWNRSNTPAAGALWRERVKSISLLSITCDQWRQEPSIACSSSFRERLRTIAVHPRSQTPFPIASHRIYRHRQNRSITFFL